MLGIRQHAKLFDLKNCLNVTLLVGDTICDPKILVQEITCTVETELIPPEGLLVKVDKLNYLSLYLWVNNVEKFIGHVIYVEESLGTIVGIIIGIIVIFLVVMILVAILLIYRKKNK
eukprot:g26892.t1